MRSYLNAVEYAKKQHLNPNPPDGSGSWYRKCQMFARSCVGAGPYGGTALQAWHNIPNKHQFNGTPRAGSLVYFDLPNVSGEAGHTVFMVEGGYCYSNDILRNGKIDKVPLSLISERWGMRRLGWIDWTPSGAIHLAPPGTVASPWAKGDVYRKKLKYGTKDSGSVRRLQYRLRARGYSTVVVSGNYDVITDNAVRSFQRSIGHKADSPRQSFIGPIEAKRLFPSPAYVIHA